jgi:MOSC domain-containing protein YiiM
MVVYSILLLLQWEQVPVARKFMNGTLKKIWIKRSKFGPMDSVEEAELIENRGILGNANQNGTRQVTIIEEEVWHEMMRELESDIDPSARRANLMISGVSVRDSIGKVLRVGSCAIQMYGETKPCKRMDEALPGLQDAMKKDWRGGAYGVIITGGSIKRGDPVSLDSL